MLPKKLQIKIDNRKAKNALRRLTIPSDLVDFSSNDYLGFSTSETILNKSLEILKEYSIQKNGATGSRLLSGNNELYHKVESYISNIHNTEAAIIFNSGYDANLGFFSSVPQRDDIIFYDEYIHASIRDGIKLSNAKALKFKHNDLEAFFEKFKKNQHDGETYLVTESVFSMDGDSPNLVELSLFCENNNIKLIVDEAHAVGVFDFGLVQKLNLENKVFARLITFGKGLGCHGAAIIGSNALKEYLVNFARSFIYTTALPPHSVATILCAYQELVALKTESSEKDSLLQNIHFFKKQVKNFQLESFFIESQSAIQSCIVSGNNRVKNISEEIRKKGFDVKPILSPTVSFGKERIRFCIHSYNSQQEITEVLQLLTIFIV